MVVYYRNLSDCTWSSTNAASSDLDTSEYVAAFEEKQPEEPPEPVDTNPFRGHRPLEAVGRPQHASPSVWKPPKGKAA